MDNEIIIDQKDLVDYIKSKIELTSEEINTVLDLEFEYLELKGVIK